MNKFLEIKTKLFEQFNASQQVTKLTKNLSAAAEMILKEAWLKAGLDQFNTQQMPTLIAVGGFGRNELFPFSDVDILFLHNEQNIELVAQKYGEQLEKFVSLCWDYGLEIGSSVRNLDECLSESAKDITVRTSLLESRYLLGNIELYAQFQIAFDKAMDCRSFFLEKLLELRQRHQKYQNTPYALEPNCKESPGGLRDLQVILWMTKAAHLGASFKDLYQRGIITAREEKELSKNQRTLQKIRAQLHLLSKRRQDVLIFEAQTALAESFGLTSTKVKRASEQIMRKYYWAAKAVTQLNEILIQNIEALIFPQKAVTPLPLSEYFIDRQGQLDILDPLLFEKKPDQILVTFLLFASYSQLTGFSTQTMRAIYNARELMNASWRNQPENRQVFLAIIKQTTGITRTLHLMNQTSVLGRYLPPFRKIVGQMQHDLFHVYTVDQHIMTVLKNVRRFFVAELAHEFPFCSELAANFDQSWILVLGAIFHDIAKGRGGDHSELGKKDVKLFCTQHGIAKEDADLVSFLVAEHLSMSQIAQKKDIYDPQVIALFAQKVQTKRNLTALYLLTVADIRGTSPKVWNAWKGKLLEDLYRATLQYLGGASFDANSQLDLRQKSALEQLRLHGIHQDAHLELWKSLDVGFFLKHDANNIAWLTRHLFNHVKTTEPIVKARLSPIGDGLQIVVYLPDQTDLFARILAYLDQSSFTILDANVHTTLKGYALDTFEVLHVQGREIGSYRDLIQMVEYDLLKTLKQLAPLPDVQKGRTSRQSRTFPMQPRVSLIPDERSELFVLSLSTNDRAGLLYAVSRILAKHQISLKNARINTLGERVEDTLLLDGERLKLNPKLQIQIETELIEALAI